MILLAIINLRELKCQRLRQINLKRVLQRELHDSCIERRIDLAKDVLIKVCCWVSSSQAVCHIERLDSKLQFLSLLDLENSRKRHVELPHCRAFKSGSAHTPERAQSRLYKRCRVQVVVDGVPVAVRAREYLVGPLCVGVSAQPAIQPGACGQPVARGISINSRQPPPGSQKTQSGICKLRCIGHRRQIQHPPAI